MLWIVFEQVLFDDSIKKPIRFYEVWRSLLTSIIRLDEVFASASFSGYLGFFEKRRIRKEIRNSRKKVLQLTDVYNKIPSRYTTDISEIDDSKIDKILDYVSKDQIDDFREIAKDVLSFVKGLYAKIEQVATKMSYDERESMYKQFKNFEKRKKLKMNYMPSSEIENN